MITPQVCSVQRLHQPNFLCMSVARKCAKWILSLLRVSIMFFTMNPRLKQRVQQPHMTMVKIPVPEVTSFHSFSVKTGPNPFHSSVFNTTKLKLESSYTPHSLRVLHQRCMDLMSTLTQKNVIFSQITNMNSSLHKHNSSQCLKLTPVLI